jgi:hypothetical protein
MRWADFRKQQTSGGRNRAGRHATLAAFALPPFMFQQRGFSHSKFPLLSNARRRLAVTWISCAIGCDGV